MMDSVGDKVMIFGAGVLCAVTVLAIERYFASEYRDSRPLTRMRRLFSGGAVTDATPGARVAVKDPNKNVLAREHSQDSHHLSHRGFSSLGGDDRQIIVIAVAGGTGSGKTTLSRAILEKFGADRVTYLNHDYYYKDLRHLSMDQRAKHNFDHPDSLDTALLVDHIQQLKEGKTVNIPQYDFKSHCRRDATLETTAKRVVLLEGILIFTDPQLVEHLDIKVFVDTPPDIRFIRRLLRDIEERGRTVESVVHQYNTTVRPMHLTFVEPSKQLADIIIPVGLNRVALDMVVSRLWAYIIQQDARAQHTLRDLTATQLDLPQDEGDDGEDTAAASK